MQVIYKNKNERRYSKRINIVDIVIYTRRVSRYVEEKYLGRFRSKNTGIWNSRGILVDIKKKFRKRNKKTVKVAKLKKLKQEEKTMEEFVQKFKRAVRESG